ncbi:hypothetical protein GCM10022222_70390 [Amycolatopsis ultiminotia]|uniref:Uncharacterized protein n=1 Tax=Amycolatopsis ultiminotia TaxID=543629 RepID=A0ABP6Y3J4_9PSEU
MNWGVLPIAAIVVAAGVIMLPAFVGGLSALTMGDDVTTTLGVNGLRALLFVHCSVKTGEPAAVRGTAGIGRIRPVRPVRLSSA